MATIFICLKSIYPMVHILELSQNFYICLPAKFFSTWHFSHPPTVPLCVPLSCDMPFFFFCYRRKPINLEKQVTRSSTALSASTAKVSFQPASITHSPRTRPAFHYAFILCRLCCHLKCSSHVFKHIILILFYFLRRFHLVDCWQGRRWRRRRRLLKSAAVPFTFSSLLLPFNSFYLCANLPSVQHNFTLASCWASPPSGLALCTVDAFAQGVSNSCLDVLGIKQTHISHSCQKPADFRPL